MVTSEQWEAVRELRRAIAQFEEAKRFREGAAFRLWKSGLPLRAAARMSGVSTATIRRWALEQERRL